MTFFFSLLASEVLLANKCNLGNFQTSDRSFISFMRFRNVYLFTRICWSWSEFSRYSKWHTVHAGILSASRDPSCWQLELLHGIFVLPCGCHSSRRLQKRLTRSVNQISKLGCYSTVCEPRPQALSIYALFVHDVRVSGLIRYRSSFNEARSQSD